MLPRATSSAGFSFRTTPGRKKHPVSRLLARTRPKLVSGVTDAFERLYREGERAVVENLTKRGWRIRASAEAEARGFWAAMLGVALEQAAFGSAFGPATAEATAQLVLNLYDPQPKPELKLS